MTQWAIVGLICFTNRSFCYTKNIDEYVFAIMRKSNTMIDPAINL